MDESVPYEGSGDANNHSEPLNKTLDHAMLVRLRAEGWGAPPTSIHAEKLGCVSNSPASIHAEGWGAPPDARSQGRHTWPPGCAKRSRRYT